MKIFSKLLRTSKRVVDYDQHKNNIGLIADTVKNAKNQIDNKGKANDGDTRFDELNKAQQEQYSKTTKRLSYFFIVLCLIGIINAVILIFKADFMPAIFCVAFTFFCAVHVFKYQMLTFQIQNPNEKAPLDAYKKQFLKKGAK